jgi:hypothetical protein
LRRYNGDAPSSTAIELARRWPRCADDDRNFDETITVLRLM